MLEDKKEYKKQIVLVSLFLLLLLAAGYQLKAMLKPNASISLALDPTCDLHKSACTLPFPNAGSIALSVHPKDIPVLQPIQLQVNIEGLDVSGVEVDLVGVDMDMGYNRPKLEQKSPVKYTGEMIIPVCMSASMEWEARVLIHTKKGTILAPYRFLTIK